MEQEVIDKSKFCKKIFSICSFFELLKFQSSVQLSELSKNNKGTFIDEPVLLNYFFRSFNEFEF